MATEEIEISQLELAEDLAPDMVLPVETPTKTFATTLEKIRQFFGLDNKTNLNMDNLNADGESLISGLGMPSDRYIDLSLGASDTEYTMPANGYLVFGKGASTGQFIYFTLSRGGVTFAKAISVNNASIVLREEVKKGSVIKVSYNAGGATVSFRFYYAEGEQ